MRKLFTLSLILLLGIACLAQPAYYNHATTTGGANVFPFNVNPSTGKKVQWVIGPGEFNQPSPVPAGNNITSLWFWANNASNGTFANLTVRMATVSTSTFITTGAFYSGPMTTVRSQTTTLAPTGANTWVEIPLTTPFLYDPTMNLIIEVSQCGFTGTGFSLRQLAYGAAPNYRRQYSDATSICGSVPLATGGDLNVAGIGLSVIPAIPCTTPADQPTSLNLTPISVVQINGSFTAALSAPTNYLVVRYPSGATPTNPVNGTVYTVGASLGLGTVISTNSSTSFSATGLLPSTTYDFYVYSYNLGLCSAAYLTTSPLFGSQTTMACTGPPGITCPANITANNTAGRCDAVVTYPPATSGGVPAPTITYSTASGSVFPVGTTVITATATNVCGSSTCAFTIVVKDAEAPAFTSNGNFPERLYYKFDGSGTSVPNLATAPPPGTATGTLTGVTQGGTGKCGGALIGTGGLSQRMSTGWITNMNAPWTISFWLGPNQVDANPSYLFGDVTTTTGTTGAFRCFYGGAAGVSNVLLRGGNADVLITGVNPAATFITVVYNGSNTVVYKNGASPQTFAVTFTNTSATGPFTVGGYSTVASINGMMDEFSMYSRALNASEVLSIYNNCPVAINSCPANITVNNTTGACNATVTYTTPVGVDNCSGVTTTQIAGLPSGSVFPVGVTTNTFRATDAAGNTANCTFTVRVNDAQPPAINCPANITVNTPVGSCTAVVNYTVTATDNCSLSSSVLVSGLASGATYPLGPTINKWMATDASGNTSTCSFIVQVNDVQLPVITVQPANNIACETTNPSFSVTINANPSPVNYQWQQWNGTAWVDITGATNSTYTINNVTIAMNANTYRVRVIGLCNTVISGIASLYVNKLPVVALTSSRSPALIPGQFLTLNVIGNPAGGTVVWRKNGNVITGYTNFTMANLTVDDIGNYSVTYTDPNGCTQVSNTVAITAQSYDKLFVYPNPNNGQFQIRFYNQASQAVSINIFDERGARVYHRSLVTGPLSYSRIDVDLSKVQAGVYVAELLDAGGKKIGTKRFIIGH